MAQIWLAGLHRPAAAAPIRPLAWELPQAKGAALKKQKQKQKQLNQNKQKHLQRPI